MGLILDSSVVIAAERAGQTVEQLIEKILSGTGDQSAALSAVGLTELIHGIYRAKQPDVRFRRQAFLDELLWNLVVHPFTKETALLAAENHGEERGQGVNHPPDELLIDEKALYLRCAFL